MSFLGQTSKSFIIAGSFTSLVIMAGTYFDAKINTNDFMNDAVVVLTSRLDDTIVRNVASSNKPSLLEEKVLLSFNQFNRKLVEGNWRITRILDEKSQRISRKTDEQGNLIIDEETGRPIIEIDNSPAFDNEGEILSNEGTYKLELIGDDLIKIGDDKDQADWEVFSFRKNKIALKKWINTGYEIIELEKSEDKVQQAEAVTNNIALTKKVLNEVKPMATNRCFAKSGDLFLSSVLNFSGNNQSFQANQDSDRGPVVSGTVQILIDSDLELAQNLEVNVDGKRVEISEINVNTCVFHAGHEDDDSESYTGTIRKYGSGYTFNFSSVDANGDLKGAVLTYVSQDEFAKVQREKEERELLASEIDEDVPDLSSGVKQPKVTTRGSDNYDNAGLNAGQTIADKVEESGFDF